MRAVRHLPQLQPPPWWRWRLTAVRPPQWVGARALFELVELAGAPAWPSLPATDWAPARPLAGAQFTRIHRPSRRIRHRLWSVLAMLSAVALFGGTAWAASLSGGISNNSSIFKAATQQLEGTVSSNHCYSTGSGSGGAVTTGNYNACTSGNPLPASLGSGASTTGTDTLASNGTSNGDKAAIASGGTGVGQFTDTTGGDTALAQGGVTYQASGPLSSKAVTFNGSTGYAETTTPYNNPNNFSIVAWFKTANAYSSGGIIMGFSAAQASTGSYSDDRMVWMDNTGHIVWATYSGSATQVLTSGSAYNNGSWHMLVAEIGASGMKLYVDGTSVGSNAAYTTPQTYAGFWHFGGMGIAGGWSNTPTSNYLSGSLAQVAVIPSQLSSGQITTLYSTDNTLALFSQGINALSPTDYWPLNDTGNAAYEGPVPGTVTGSSAPDVSGTNDTGTYQGTSGTNYWTGQGGPNSLTGSSGVTFDSSGYMQTATAYTASTTYPSAMTEALWFNTTSTSGGVLSGTDGSQSTTTNSNTDNWPLYMNTSGQLQFGNNGSNTWDGTGFSSTAYNDGKWHLAVAEWSSSSGDTLYVDGTSVATNNCSDCKTVYSGVGATYWHLGWGDATSFPSAPTGFFMWANLSQAAIFTSALTSAQITTLYNSTSSQAYYSNVMALTPKQYWPLQDTSVSNTAYDTSGNSNTGTLKSGATLGVPPSTSTPTTTGADGQLLNGSTGWDQTTTSYANPTTFSAVAWFRTTSNAGGDILSFSNVQGATGASSADRQLTMNNSGQISFFVWPSASQFATSTAAYNDGNWHMVVASIGAGGMQVWVDGTEVGSNVNTASQNYTGYWHIGGDSSVATGPTRSSSYLNGSLSEVAVIPSQLSSGQISTLYGEGSATAYSTAMLSLSPTAYWPMQETSGTSVSDTSGNTNTATAQSGVTVGSGGPTTLGGNAPTGADGQLLNGSTGYDQTATTYSNPNNISEVIWFKTANAYASGGVLIGGTSSQGTTAPTSYDRVLWMDTSGKLHYEVNNGANRYLVSGSAYNDGNWHFAVAEVGASGQQLWVDNSEVASAGAVVSAKNYTLYWHLGWGYTNLFTGAPTSNFIAGNISEAAIVPSQLSSGTISTLYGETSAGAYATYMESLSATAYWPMQEPSGTAVTDMSGNDAATAQTGVTTGSGGPTQLGGASSGNALGVAFNGTSGNVQTTTNYASNTPTAFSLVGWFKTSSGGGIVGQNNTQNPTSASTYDFGVYVDSTGYLDWANTSVNVSSASNSAVNNGAWHFFCVTFNSSTDVYTMYVDGTVSSQSGGTMADSLPGGYWGLGYTKTAAWYQAPASNYFNGSLADVALIPSVLSSSNDTTLYNETTQSAYTSAVQGFSPSWFYQMQETSGTTATDSSTHSNTGTYETGTTVNQSGPTTLSGAGGGNVTAGTSNEATTYATTPGTGPFGNGTPASAINENNTDYIFTANSDTNPTNISEVAWFKSTTYGGIISYQNGGNRDRGIWLDNTGHLVFHTYNGADQDVTSPSTYTDGNWHMVVAEVGSSGMQMYVDGVRVASNTAYTTPQNFTGSWELAYAGEGTDSPTSDSFNGSLSEMAVIPSQLTAAQVGTLYSAGSPQSYALDMRLLSPTSYWPLQDAAGSTTLADTSGNANTATPQVTGGTTAGASGPTQLSNEQSSSGVTLDGDGGAYVQTTTSYANPNNISQVAWFQAPSGWSLGNPIMSFTSSQSNAAPTSYDRQIWMDNTGHLVYGVNNGSTQEVTSANTYNDGNWHMVVAEIGAGGQQLWVDGTEVASAGGVTSAQNYTGYWHLGFADSSGWTNGATDWDYNGSLSEAAVIPSQLTSAQISTLYQAGNTASYALDMAQLDNGSASASYWPLQDSASNIASTVEIDVEQTINSVTTCIWPATSCTTNTTTNELPFLPAKYNVTAPTGTSGTTTNLITLTMKLSGAAGAAISGYLIQPNIAFGTWKSSNNWSAQICYASSSVPL